MEARTLNILSTGRPIASDEKRLKQRVEARSARIRATRAVKAARAASRMKDNLEQRRPPHQPPKKHLLHRPPPPHCHNNKLTHNSNPEHAVLGLVETLSADFAEEHSSIQARTPT